MFCFFKDEGLVLISHPLFDWNKLQPVKYKQLFSQLVPPSLNSWLMRLLLFIDLQPPRTGSERSPSHCSATFIKPLDHSTKRNLILEYLNEIKLKWGTIIEREDLHRGDLISALALQSVFFFSWIEYQLISWVICCRGNLWNGWEHAEHIQHWGKHCLCGTLKALKGLKHSNITNKE